MLSLGARASTGSENDPNDIDQQGRARQHSKQRHFWQGNAQECIQNLLQGSMRFNTLRATLGHISSKTLSSRLRLLEELDFVQRLAFLETPPRVEYHLTEKGRELGDVIAALERFGNKHLSSSVVSAECGKCLSLDEEPATVEGVQ